LTDFFPPTGIIEYPSQSKPFLIMSGRNPKFFSKSAVPYPVIKYKFPVSTLSKNFPLSPIYIL